NDRVSVFVLSPFRREKTVTGRSNRDVALNGLRVDTGHLRIVFELASASLMRARMDGGCNRGPGPFVGRGGPHHVIFPESTPRRCAGRLASRPRLCPRI